MVASRLSSLPVSSPTATEEESFTSKPSMPAIASDRLWPARMLSSASPNWLSIQRLPMASRAAASVVMMGTPLPYRLDSVLAKRAVQILRFSTPTTGACRMKRSHWRRTFGCASRSLPPKTMSAAATSSTGQLVPTKSLTSNSSWVRNGRVSIWSNIGLNCGRTKVIKIAITPTMSTDRIMGYIMLLPTCWFILCSRS